MEMSDRQVEAALDALPMAASPSHLVERVMLRVRQPQVVFHLDFLDVALPVFFALLSALGLAAAALALRWLDPWHLVEWQFNLQMAMLRLGTAPFHATLLAALFGLFSLLMVSLGLLLGWGGMARSRARN